MSLDPSDWFLYAFDRYIDRTATGVVPTINWGDYDKLGVDDQSLIITSLQYRETDGASMGAKVRILDKAQLIAGEAPATWLDVWSAGLNWMSANGLVRFRSCSTAQLAKTRFGASCSRRTPRT